MFEVQWCVQCLGSEKKKFVQCSIFDVRRSRSNDIDGDKFGSSQKDIDQECGKTETDASVHFFCQARKIKLLLKARGEFQPGIGGSVTAKKLRHWQERRG